MQNALSALAFILIPTGAPIRNARYDAEKYIIIFRDRMPSACGMDSLYLRGPIPGIHTGCFVEK